MPERLKILFVITRAEMGGAQTHVVDLLRGMRQHCDVELATGETGFLTDTAAMLGVPCHIVPDLIQPLSPLRDARAVAQTTALLRQVKPSLVHAHTSKAGVVARLAAYRAGIPSVFTAHTWCFAEGTSWKWKLAGKPAERLSSRLSGRIINVSDANRRLALANRVGSEPTHITIHNGIPDTPWRAQVSRGETPRIIMHARFAEQKAQDLLLEAVSGISLPFELVFVGDGPTRAAAEQRAAELDLTDRVKFLGQRVDIPLLLAASHIFALFSHWEGFPISTLEAMRAGLPVVVSDVGGSREAINEECGYVVAPRDVAGFRKCLTELLENVSLRSYMGANARARWEKHFTVDGMIRKTLEVYRQVTRTVPEPVEVTATALDSTTVVTDTGRSDYGETALPVDSVTKY